MEKPMTETSSTERTTLPDKDGIIALFAKPKGIEEAIGLIEKEVRSEVQDYSRARSEGANIVVNLRQNR